MTYAERIRNGDVDPWVGSGVSGCRRSAAIAADELDTLAAGDPRRAVVEQERQAWLDRAAIEGERA